MKLARLLLSIIAVSLVASGARAARTSSAIPTETNAAVEEWVRYFSIDDHARFDRFMQRGARMKMLIEDILSDNGAPRELYYLAMIESGFSRRARSVAAAVGVWQFGASTGRLAGLRIDREVDERIDVIRATRAAALHLRRLKAEFGDWYLAMAAYNCGVGCVHRAIRHAHSRDFWTIVRRGALPDETANYVPKFQAAMTIASHPQLYGFRAHSPEDNPDYRRVRVPARERVVDIAIRQQVPISTLLQLNPHLIAGRTPSGRRGYEIWLPSRGRLD